MHPYRSHNCGALTAAQDGQTVRLSGWVTASVIMAVCCFSICAIITG